MSAISKLFREAESKLSLPVLLAKDIDWDRSEPCGDCPFMKSSPYHEGVASSIPQYVGSIMGHTFAHTCHKTDNRQDCDGPRNFPGERPKHCAGAILMLLKTGNGMDLQLPLLEAMERGDLENVTALAEKAKADKNVFTLREFLKFYADELHKKLSNPAARAAIRRAKRKGRLTSAPHGQE